jgi:hypothetical protein
MKKDKPNRTARFGYGRGDFTRLTPKQRRRVRLRLNQAAKRAKQVA